MSTARAAGLLLMLCVCRPETVMAQDAFASRGFEVRGGVLAHDVPYLWSGFRLEGGVDLNAEVLFGSGMPFLFGTVRPALGASVNTSGYTSRAYADLRWEVDTPSRIFFALGIGAAVHNGLLGPTEPDQKALGSRVLFHFPIEIGLRLGDRQSVSIFFEHVSNGNLATYNEGLDSIGVRYGYKF